MEGNQTLTLALVWQLMRAYTLSLLSKLNEDGTPIVESEIISWANNKVCGPSHCFFIGVDRKVGQHQKWFVLSSTNNCMSSKEICIQYISSWPRGARAHKSSISKTRATRRQCPLSTSSTPWRPGSLTTLSSRLARSSMERSVLSENADSVKNVILPGLPFQCKVCCQHGSKDWSASVCPTWRY